MEPEYKYDPIEIAKKNPYDMSSMFRIVRLAYPNLIAGDFKEFSMKIDLPKGISKNDFQGT